MNTDDYGLICFRAGVPTDRRTTPSILQIVSDDLQTGRQASSVPFLASTPREALSEFERHFLPEPQGHTDEAS